MWTGYIKTNIDVINYLIAVCDKLFTDAPNVKWPDEDWLCAQVNYLDPGVDMKSCSDAYGAEWTMGYFRDYFANHKL